MNLAQPLFFLHIGIIIFGVSMGFFLPLSIVILIVLLHRLQFFVFHDCLLSKMQKKVHSLPRNTHFLSFAVQKIFGKKINNRQCHQLDVLLILLTLGIAITNTFI